MEGGEVRPPAITGAPTSVAAFVGPAATGALGRPVACAGMTDFRQEFGHSSAALPLGEAVRLFFANGGTQARVLRVEPDATAAGFEPLRDVHFNLLNLAPSEPALTAPELAAAAHFCRERCAMLLAEPPASIADPVAAARFAETLASAAGEAAGDIALYYPRLRLTGAPAGSTVAPGGAVAGLIARTDAAAGVWSAPAGTSYPLAEVDELAQDLVGAELEDLSDRAVNCLRSFTGAGPVVWGARTLAGASDSDSEWKYLPLRRLALFLEQSIDQGTQWAVFEPNGEELWGRIRQVVEDFLHCLWREGAFPASAPRDAFFARCDRTTMTQDDIEAGRLMLHVGIAPLRPAEFVVLRIGPFSCAGAA